MGIGAKFGELVKGSPRVTITLWGREKKRYGYICGLMEKDPQKKIDERLGAATSQGHGKVSH